MSFFKKLKNRMFKSSSKLEQGLDDIIEDGGEEELVEEAPVIEEAPMLEQGAGTPDESESAAELVTELVTEPVTELVTEPVTELVAEPAAEVAPIDTLVEAVAEIVPDVVVDELEELVVAPLDDVVAEGGVSPEPEPEVPTDMVAAPQAVPEVKKPGLIGRLLGRKDTEPTEAAPQVASETAPQTAPAKNREKKTVVKRALDDDMLERIEELLITADMGVDTALRVTANMAEGRFGKKMSTDEIKQLLAAEITRIMEPVAKPLPIYTKKPQVVLVVGVNGSGKTTTIGKLASQFKAAGKDVVIAAGDTFRAAAVEQLQVWGERANVPVLTAPEGSDPASLAYDAMTQAEADGADLLMIDTAGRLHNRADLMEELSKIVRVIQKKDPTAPHNTLLVLDATTGQNALNQVKVFQELANVSGLVMTKLDGTAKGGVLVALADKFGLPIHAIGVGEQIDDLDAFDPEEFAHALTGLEV